MNKEKILYVGGFELPDKNAAANRVIANAKVLSEIGYDVQLVGVSKKPSVEKFYSFGFESFEERYPSSNLEWIKFIVNIKYLKKIILNENPKYIILYNYPAFKMLKLLRFCRKKNIKVYADVTEWYCYQGLHPLKIIKRFDVLLRMKYLHFKLDGVIVISKFLKDFYSMKMTNIIQIPPLVDLKSKKFDLVLDEKLSQDEYIRFVYAGSPGVGGKDKLDVVIKHLSKLINRKQVKIKFDIIGLTKQEFVENFNFINFDEINDNFITFHGRVPHSEAIRFVKNSNYSIFFRENYLVNNAGFPTKFVESISLGTPVITNRTSDLEYYYNKFGNCMGFLLDDLREDRIENTLSSIAGISKNINLENKRECVNLKIFDFKNYISEFKKMF